MAQIKAFSALGFSEQAGKMEDLVCPPYDIIGEDERKALLARNRHNIVRLELPQEGEDPYAEAGKTLAQWLSSNILERDNAEKLYIYEEEFTDAGTRKKIKGIIGRVKLEPFENGVVLPHEETLSKAKTDRFNLMCATGCNFSSIYSLYFDRDLSVASQADRLSSGAPDREFATDDGIVHRVWALSDPAAVQAITTGFSNKKLYIADGHHRYETALNYRNHLREQGILTDESHPANYVMMMLVNMENEGLVVYPTHRIVRDLASFDREALLKELSGRFIAEDIDTGRIRERLDQAQKENKKAFVLYTGKASLLTLRDLSVMDGILPDASAALRGLDVSVLHSLILERGLGIDKENMAGQKNLIYTRDYGEAIRAVDSGEANCSFIINSTRVDEIAAVAGAGEKMPQKSTYFYPKLITGHVMNPLTP